MERVRSSENSKVSSLNGSTSNERQYTVLLVKLNGLSVKVLQDTGFPEMIVDRAFIPASMVILGTLIDEPDPDPDWKAEDQRGPRARISAGNNNDDDNQGDNMPSWMFNEESNREETKNKDSKRRSQPSSRRMITVLHKMSKKSKKAPQKDSELLDHVAGSGKEE